MWIKYFTSMQLNLLTETHGTSCINCKDDVNDRDPELERLNTEIIEEKSKKNTKKPKMGKLRA